MSRVTGIDHLVIRVGDYAKSKAFYSKLFDFLGAKLIAHRCGGHHGSDDGSGRRARDALGAVTGIHQRNDGPDQTYALDATTRQHQVRRLRVRHGAEATRGRTTKSARRR